MNAISMRELQKLSAEKIRNLPHPVPIKCGGETVGMLSPVRKPDPARLLAALQKLDELSLTLTPEERRKAEELVGPLDID